MLRRTQVLSHARQHPAAPKTSELMNQRSRLHVPNAPARPGDKPDFSYVRVSAAGAVAKPDVTAPVGEVTDLANALIRVLDDNHIAVVPWNPHLEAPDLQ